MHIQLPGDLPHPTAGIDHPVRRLHPTPRQTSFQGQSVPLYRMFTTPGNPTPSIRDEKDAHFGCL